MAIKINKDEGHAESCQGTQDAWSLWEEDFKEQELLANDVQKQEAVMPDEEEQQARRLSRQIEWENLMAWERADYTTINTLLMQYKATKDSQDFLQVWSKYLKPLTHAYVDQFLVRKLTVMAKKHFLTDYQQQELEDAVYVTLIKAIHNWEPNRADGYTRDFAAYYQQAIKYFAFNIYKRNKSKRFKGTTIQNVDFSDDKEMTSLLEIAPDLRMALQHNADYDRIEWNDYIDHFLMDKLNDRQKMIFRMLYHQQLRKNEICGIMKLSRNTVYREIQKIQQLWITFEQEND